MTCRRRIVALLVAALGPFTPLVGQSPVPRAVSDSALLLMVTRGDDARDAIRRDVVPLCQRLKGQAKTACEALALVQAGTPARVPSRRVASSARILGSELGVRLTGTEVLYPLLDLYLGFPTYEAEDEMRRGRSTLTSLVAEYPTWGPGWYGLASAVLDVENRPDSALALLSRATASGDVPTILTRFLAVRAQLRMGHPDARDSLSAVLTGTRADLLRIWVTRHLCGTIFGCPTSELTRPVIDMMAERLSQPPWAYPILVRSRAYAVLEPDGTHLQVALSVLRQNLAFQEMATPQGQRFVYPLRVRIVAIREDGLRVVQDTVRMLATAIPPTRPREQDRGQLELRSELVLPPGEYLIGVFAFDERGGSAAHTHTVNATALLGAPRITTFSAGVPGRGAKVPTDDGDIWLAPGGEWLTSDSVALFAQFAGLRPGTSYRANLAFLPIPQTDGRSPIAPPRADRGVSISATFEAESEVLTWRRTLVPGGLGRGAWCARLELQVGESVVAERTEPLLVALDYQSWPDFLQVNYVVPLPQACGNVNMFRFLGKETGQMEIRPSRGLLDR